MRIREGYMSYLDMLDRLRLFSHANALISTSTDQYISQLSKSGVIMRACCAKCGKEVGDSDVQTAVGAVWCGGCKRCAGLCVLCQKPVTRLLLWCPICGHGGHSACLQQWFSEHLTCPSGCGHRCSMKCRKSDRCGAGVSSWSTKKSTASGRGLECESICLRKTNKINSKAISIFKFSHNMAVSGDA
mmetsp:Transcript_6969/g.13319  ORF Transcript_6969/g.13319 Transcript_6969/m.13319 type:complete len:187 (-) Transcript_6969:1029-1589(-)